jgi:flagellar biosynthesis protein FlhF
MDIKVFSAETTAEGYRMIEERFGPDTMVMRVERDPKANAFLFTVSVPPITDESDRPAPPDVMDRATSIMRRAGFSSTLVNFAREHLSKNAAESETEAIGMCLDKLIDFVPFEAFARRHKVIFFVGSPGSGKTATIAKAANSLVGAGMKVTLLNFDRDRLGGASQLAHLASILGLPLFDLNNRNQPDRVDPSSIPPDGIILCDTSGYHPWKFGELDTLITHAERLRGATVLVCPAGMDATETADMLVSARRLSINHVIVTKCDMTRRLGATLTPIILEKFGVVGCQRSRILAERIAPSNGTALASLLVENQPRAVLGGK